ncbi:proline racemase family protein [Cereibacter sphaeroides]|jgi:proline racemase|uniref:4-hydroxyproline 2-epimerase n=1 Tax=Cereibacter sphaeroides (strain ATCC 17029 / ATH 2.4.9) TaxID=349101 RepID=4HYPE_CERS1|nr:RecName: Full=4-hydroxyproline 2-epimerase; Short=4Hyp 2-epimerase; Short=4HypE [Cereibacter sphaeroides ATCC 17029]ABN78264.1 proline racemase [Cereibacter sphaeroides ATCC 17029]
MRVQDVYNVIYTHTEGEPLCIIYSGVPYPAGSTILEKRAFLEENYDWLRKALMREPRGHADMFGVFLTPPSSRDYDAGLIYIDGKEYSHMCGHGTIAVAMAMVANGLVARDPSGLTRIRFETTAGLVVAEVAHEDDRVLWTRFENVPAYVAAQDIAFELPGYGPLKADLVWGGNYFGIIDLRGTSLRIAPENGSELSRMGLIAREEIRKKVTVQHPTEAHINNLNFVTFWHEPTIEGCLYKNVHVFSAGQLDRSPGGTGTSAMMAYFEARGVIGLNQPITSEGLLGSGTFEGCLIGETTLGTVRAVRPTVKGTAGMLGTASWTINREDPVDAGFLVL